MDLTHSKVSKIEDAIKLSEEIYKDHLKQLETLFQSIERKFQFFSQSILSLKNSKESFIQKVEGFFGSCLKILISKKNQIFEKIESFANTEEQRLKDHQNSLRIAVELGREIENDQMLSKHKFLLNSTKRMICLDEIKKRLHETSEGLTDSKMSTIGLDIDKDLHIANFEKMVDFEEEIQEVCQRLSSSLGLDYRAPDLLKFQNEQVMGSQTTRKRRALRHLKKQEKRGLVAQKGNSYRMPTSYKHSCSKRSSSPSSNLRKILNGGQKIKTQSRKYASSSRFMNASLQKGARKSSCHPIEEAEPDFSRAPKQRFFGVGGSPGVETALNDPLRHRNRSKRSMSSCRDSSKSSRPIGSQKSIRIGKRAPRLPREGSAKLRTTGNGRQHEKKLGAKKGHKKGQMSIKRMSFSKTLHNQRSHNQKRERDKELKRQQGARKIRNKSAKKINSRLPKSRKGGKKMDFTSRVNQENKIDSDLESNFTKTQPLPKTKNFEICVLSEQRMSALNESSVSNCFSGEMKHSRQFYKPGRLTGQNNQSNEIEEPSGSSSVTHRAERSISAWAKKRKVSKVSSKESKGQNKPTRFEEYCTKKGLQRTASERNQLPGVGYLKVNNGLIRDMRISESSYCDEVRIDSEDREAPEGVLNVSTARFELTEDTPRGFVTTRDTRHDSQINYF